MISVFCEEGVLHFGAAPPQGYSVPNGTTGVKEKHTASL